MSTRTPVAVVISTLAMTASIVIAASTFWPVYESPRFVIAVAAGVLGGALVALPAALLRWSSPIVILVTAVLFLAIGVPVAVPSESQAVVLPTLPGLVDLVAGVALGWRQLLTISLPVGEYQALLVPPFVLVLVGTVVALSLALRTRRPELAALVPLAIFGLGIAFGPTAVSRPIAAPIALLLTVLLWLVWVRWRRRTAAIRALADAAGTTRAAPIAVGARGLLAAAAILVVASIAAVGAASALPAAADRTVLRTAAEIPFDPRSQVSPLSGFRSFWQDPMRDRLLFTVDGLPAGSMVRLATMDTYDGVVYSVGSAQVTSESGTFSRVPSRIDRSGIAGEPLTLTVQVAEYAGIWLPTAGRLEAIAFQGPRAGALADAFYYNDTSGTAAQIAGLAQGDGYRLDALLPAQPTRAQLADLTPGSAVVPAAREVPEALTARVQEYVRGFDGDGERLLAMLDGLAQDGYISHGVGDEPPSRSGHAADRLEQLVTDPIMLGDAEQYAVAAALMARDLGFPARVVLGFLPVNGEVRGRDVTAWIEVDTAQYGWVSIDPNPAPRPIPEELPEDNETVSRPQTIVPPPVADDETLDRQQTPDTAQEDPSPGSPLLAVLFTVLRIGGWVLAAGVLIAAPFAAVIAAKLRRRTLRRTAPTVIERVSGGWKEFEDAMLDRGIVPGRNATRSEIAEAVGRQQAGVLAAVADHAVFSPDPLGDPDAESVWRAVDDLTASMDAERTRWERIRARISLRSLGGSVRGLLPAVRGRR